MFGLPFAERKGAVWAGVIQNSGGFGIDYSLLDRKLWFSLEAFDFGREMELDPTCGSRRSGTSTRTCTSRAATTIRWSTSTRAPFLGAGLRWTDDDLKYLMGSVPSSRGV